MAYAQIQLSDLLTRLADRWESVPFWSQADAISSLQETMRWWNLFTGQWKKRVLIPTITATSFPTGWIYTLPSEVTFALRASWQQIPLKPVSETDLDLGYRNWRSHTIASGGSVPTRPTFWAKLGVTKFALYPADTSALNSIEVDAVVRAPILCADPVNPTAPELAAFFDLGGEEEPIILDEALHIAAYKLGGTYWKKTFPGHQRFLQAAVDKNARLKAETAFRKALGLDLGRQQRPFRRDPDQAALQSLSS